jgi:YD repeat-containing protein
MHRSRSASLACTLCAALTLTLSTAHGQFTQQYEYDALGRLTSTRWDNGTALRTDFDSAGNALRVRSFLDDGGGGGGGGGGGCFIATAAYGSALDPHVEHLRGFRDRWLLPHAAGRAFVAWYYDASPPLADFIARHDGARWTARALLAPLVYSIAYPRAALLVALGLGALLWRRRVLRRNSAQGIAARAG